MSLNVVGKKGGSYKSNERFGNGELFFLRKALALKVGYEYVSDGHNPFNLTLRWKSELEKPELTRFFLHPDCDGRISTSDSKKLYKDFEDIHFENESDAKSYDHFMSILKESVDHDMHWVFV